VFVGNHSPVSVNDADLAIRAHDPVFQLVWPLFLYGGAKGLLDKSAILRMDQIQEPCMTELERITRHTENPIQLIRPP
jgi:hypothetical protein